MNAKASPLGMTFEGPHPGLPHLKDTGRFVFGAGWREEVRAEAGLAVRRPPTEFMKQEGFEEHSKVTLPLRRRVRGVGLAGVCRGWARWTGPGGESRWERAPSGGGLSCCFLEGGLTRWRRGTFRYSKEKTPRDNWLAYGSRSSPRGIMELAARA